MSNYIDGRFNGPDIYHNLRIVQSTLRPALYLPKCLSDDALDTGTPLTVASAKDSRGIRANFPGFLMMGYRMLFTEVAHSTPCFVVAHPEYLCTGCSTGRSSSHPVSPFSAGRRTSAHA